MIFRQAFFIVFIVFLSSTYHSQEYKNTYTSEFNSALTFYKEHKEKFIKSASLINETPEFLFSIIAPEVSQFNTVQNVFELNTLKILYVQGGSGYGNFSVGFFQMKPKFIEDMEKVINKDKELANMFDFLPNVELSVREQRKNRLFRLDSLEAQLSYLEAYCSIMKIKTKNMRFSSREERLKYFASAYNSGFNLEEEEILKMMKLKFFPRYGALKYNYANICVEFFNFLNNKKSTP
jgi:hypothetical protein